MFSNLKRRWPRTVLTVAGMGAGVFALFLMSSMAEHFGQLSRHVREAFSGRVYVCEKPSFWAGGGILPDSLVDTTRAISGVEKVVPILVGRLQTRRLVVLGLPQVLIGVPPADARDLWRGATLADGGWLEPGDTDACLLGSDVAYALGARVGDTVHLIDRPFKVKGVLSHTGTLEDGQALAPLPTVQDVMQRERIITGMLVIPSVDAEVLAATLKTRLKRVEVIPPSRMQEEVERSLRLWEALALGSGSIAASTGALCIVIVMVVAVHERTYEIGVKKAIGASSGQIAREFLSESAVLAAAGWILGAGLALAFVLAWDEGFRREGLFLFRITPRVVVGSFLAATALGVVAGAVPAMSAARLDPVHALRRRL